MTKPKIGRPKLNLRAEDARHTKDAINAWKAQHPGIDLSQLFLTMNLFRIARMLEMDIDNWCQKFHGISGADARVILALRRAGPPFRSRPSDLFRALIVTSGGMTKQINRLGEKKLVRRIDNPDHGGSFLIEMTARGRRVADQITEYLAGSTPLCEISQKRPPSERQQGEEYINGLLSDLEILSAYRAAEEEMPD